MAKVRAGEAGTYEVLLRYEAAYMFETPVRVTIAKRGGGSRGP